jgi:hypothetical protein
MEIVIYIFRKGYLLIKICGLRICHRHKLYSYFRWKRLTKEQCWVWQVISAEMKNYES